MTSNKHPRGYYEIFKNVEKELAPIIFELGHFPTQSELVKMKRSDLIQGMTRYHGGMQNVSALMGYESAQLPRGYWQNWGNVSQELNELEEKLGHFPLGPEIREENPCLISAIEKYHGGYCEVSIKRGHEPARKKEGYWDDDKNIEKEAREFMQKHGYTELPYCTVFANKGIQKIQVAITMHGGFRKWRKRLGGTNKGVEPGIWGDRRYVLNVAKKIKKDNKLDRLPSGNALRRMGHSTLNSAISRYHGGFESIRKELGEKTREEIYAERKEMQKRANVNRNIIPRKPRYPFPEKEELEREYSNTPVKVEVLAKNRGVSTSTYNLWLRKSNIPVRSNWVSIPQALRDMNNEELRVEYCSVESVGELSTKWKVSKDKLRDFFKERGVKVLTPTQKFERDIPSKEDVERLFITEKKSFNEIARIKNVLSATVKAWCEHYGFKPRSISQARFLTLGKNIEKPNDELLKDEYDRQGLTTVQMAEMHGVSDPTIGNWLREAGVKVKDERGKYDDAETRKNTLADLVSRSGKKPKEINTKDFVKTKREDGMTYQGLLGWYKRNHKLQPSKSIIYMVKEFYGADSNLVAKTHIKTTKRIKDFVEWDKMKIELDFILSRHPELNGQLPATDWLEEKGYYVQLRAIIKYHGGIIAVREKLGQRVLREPNGKWKEFDSLAEEIARIIRNTPELNNHFPNVGWFSHHGYHNIANGIRRYHRERVDEMKERVERMLGRQSEKEMLEKLLEGYLDTPQENLLRGYAEDD